MKLSKAVAVIVLGLVLAIAPWSVPTDTAVQQAVVGRSAVAESVVDQQSVVDENYAVAEAPRMIAMSTQCWCVGYGMTSISDGSATKQA